MEAVNSHEQSTKAICPFRARPQLVRGTKGTTSESSSCPSFSDAIFWMKFLSQYIAMVWNELDQMFLARKIPVVKTWSPSHCKMLLHDYIRLNIYFLIIYIYMIHAQYFHVFQMHEIVRPSNSIV